MYRALLAVGDTTFVDSINRAFPRFRTGRLDRVVAAVQAAQANLTASNLADIINTMHEWRTNEPAEFANRGATNGVAYRLWMEAKQFIRNNFHQNIAYPDPPMPGGCPGTVLLGIYVPPGEEHREICHGFAYRWAVAAGKMAENAVLPAAAGQFNPMTATPVLYPLGAAGYPAARAGGVIALQPGDIVVMFTPPQDPPGTIQPGVSVLGHSLIAETPTTWFSANNSGTFGVGTGRSQIDTTQNFGIFLGLQSGWVAGTNQWRRPDLIVVEVFYRR
jgi:hypothetical protein